MALYEVDYILYYDSGCERINVEFIRDCPYCINNDYIYYVKDNELMMFDATLSLSDNFYKLTDVENIEKIYYSKHLILVDHYGMLSIFKHNKFIHTDIIVGNKFIVSRNFINIINGNTYYFMYDGYVLDHYEMDKQMANITNIILNPSPFIQFKHHFCKYDCEFDPEKCSKWIKTPKGIIKVNGYDMRKENYDYNENFVLIRGEINKIYNYMEDRWIEAFDCELYNPEIKCNPRQVKSAMTNK